LSRAVLGKTASIFSAISGSRASVTLQRFSQWGAAPIF
jgi:hypothetical protein